MTISLEIIPLLRSVVPLNNKPHSRTRVLLRYTAFLHGLDMVGGRLEGVEESFGGGGDYLFKLSKFDE